MLPLSLAKNYTHLLEMGMNVCPAPGQGSGEPLKLRVNVSSLDCIRSSKGTRTRERVRGTALGLIGLDASASELQQARCGASLGLPKVTGAQASGTSTAPLGSGLTEEQREPSPGAWSPSTRSHEYPVEQEMLLLEENSRVDRNTENRVTEISMFYKNFTETNRNTQLASAQCIFPLLSPNLC